MRPTSAEAASDAIARGNAALQADRLDDAERCYRQATALAPGLAAAHLNLGFVLTCQRRHRDAIAPLQEALRLQPSVDAHYLLGGAQAEQGSFALAIENLERAIAADASFVLAYRDLGKLLCDTGQNQRAQAVLRQALALTPGAPDLLLFLGNVLAAQGRLDDAVATFGEAIERSPNDPNLHSNLALALANLGDDTAAIASARRALALDPGMFTARSNLLLALSRHPACSPAEYLQEARAYDAALAERGMTRPPMPMSPETDPSRRLRIGFVSGDLRSHPVGFFLDNVMAHWDGDAMDAIAYSNHRSADALTARLRERFVAWHDISGLSDDAAEALIRADRIDVLIDLSGHTGGNRLPLFARRPAAVQVSWLGYWASTGVAAVDYVLCDPVSRPEQGEAQFSEALWALPDTRLCFSPPAGAESLAVAAPPAMTSGHITFGSFQGLPKLTDAVLTLWVRVLNEVPGARLRLQSAQFRTEVVRQRVRERLVRLGAATERIRLVEPGPRLAYLAAHAEVDILLDTFPHPGGTTTCEALWMGVPTVTLAGETLLARQGAALLSCAGLNDWVAASEDEYVAIASRQAGDVLGLARLRTGLRAAVQASPLFDGERFSRKLHAALRDMWEARSSLSSRGPDVARVVQP